MYCCMLPIVTMYCCMLPIVTMYCCMLPIVTMYCCMLPIVTMYCCMLPIVTMYYYTSRENTLIPLDESHVSRLLATCVSVGSVTAGATQGVAPAVKETTY